MTMALCIVCFDIVLLLLLICMGVLFSGPNTLILFVFILLYCLFLICDELYIFNCAFICLILFEVLFVPICLLWSTTKTKLAKRGKNISTSGEY